MTVVCVLRSGGVYSPVWVNRLRAGVARHLPMPHRFVCLTDATTGFDPDVDVVPLQHDWPRWWPKMEMYEPGKFGDGLVVYLDLDSVVMGDLSDFAAYEGPRAVLRDLLRPTIRIGTGMLLWHGDALADVWEAFMADPAGNMAKYHLRSDFFTQRQLDSVHFVQDLWPGQVVSSKREARNAVPPNARVVCMHGNPRMTDLHPTHFLRRQWEAAASYKEEGEE